MPFFGEVWLTTSSFLEGSFLLVLAPFMLTLTVCKRSERALTCIDFGVLCGGVVVGGGMVSCVLMLRSIFYLCFLYDKPTDSRIEKYPQITSQIARAFLFWASC